MDNRERNLIKKKILKCLTEDFGNNQALFDKKGKWQVFNGTDLNMVMDAVVLGLELSKHDINQQQVKKCDLADVVKPKGTLCLYESGDTTSARCIHCGREKWEHKRA